MKPELCVHPELKNYLPDQSVAQIQQLRRNLERNGCLDPVLYWQHDGQRWIVDGATRWSLCVELGIPYPTKPMEFDSIIDVKRWIIDHQGGRRQTDDEVIAMLYQRQEREIAATQKQQKTSDKQGDLGPSVDNPHPKTVSEKAKEAGVDRPTMSRAEKVSKKGIRELEQAVVEKKVTLKEAAKIADEPPKRQREKLARGQTKATEPKPANPKDELGRDIPVDLVEAFNARAVYDDLLNQLTKFTTTINPLLGDPRANKKPIAGGEHLAPHIQRIANGIKDLRSCVKFARPYAPCHLSHKVGKCPGCGGCGFMTQELYERSGVK